MAITNAQQARQMYKKGSEKPAVQGGVENYLGRQPEVQAPRKWKSSPDKPETELAYITKAEKDLILKANIHGGLEKGPNMGPSGIMSLDSFGDIGGAGAAGADTAASGEAMAGRGFSGIGPNESRQDFANRKDLQRANLQRAEKAQAERLGYRERQNIANFKSRKPKSKFGMNLLSGLMSLINPALGLFTRGINFFGDKLQDLRGYNPDGTPRTQAEYEKARLDRINQNRIDNILNRDAPITEMTLSNLEKLGYTGDMPAVGSTSTSRAIARDLEINPEQPQFAKSYLQSIDTTPDITATNLNDLEGLTELDFIGRTNLNDLEGILADKGLEVAPGSIIDQGLVEVPADSIDQGITTASSVDNFPVKFASALTTPTAGKFGLNLMEYSKLKNNRYNDSQIQEAIKGGYVNDLLKTLSLATGGRVNAMGGGIMDLETGRQMYGLGKLVKKATRAVKKIAKSPIGKAALLYTATGGLGNLAAGKGFGSFFSGFTSPSTFLGRAPGIFTKGGLKNIASRIGLGKFKNIGGERIFEANKLGSFLSSPFGAITSASALAGLLTPKEEQEGEFDLDEYYKQVAFNPNAELSKRILGTQFAAQGGRIGYAEGSKEPVAKKVMPLLDMDGMEKDYRAEGGFVPIGRMEKADDVPARLSKNEFVFTADAVRNAGDGDIDKGAEVMYNMMKNLEAGGEVSEESQGLEGARKMFQTSQRLGEVI